MLSTYIQEGGYDLGLATDGDADRIALVDERDLASVRVGQPVEVRLPVLPGAVLRGEVAALDQARELPGRTSTEAAPPARARAGSL